MNLALTPRLGRDINIAANVVLFLAIMGGIGALALYPQRQGTPTIAAPELALDEQVGELALDEQVGALLPSLEEIDYLQWCLVAAQSEVPLDQFPNARQREDVRYAREEMSYDERFAAYLLLEEMKQEQAPTIKFDLSVTENMV